MKSALLFATVWFSSVCFCQTTILTYSGNGKNNFGGAVGQGSLTITETPDSVYFSLTKGPGSFDSLLVFYLDLQSGGIASTSVLAGSSSDQYLSAATGNNPARGAAVLNFPEDFRPDGAVVFNKDSGRIFFFLTIPFFGTTVVSRDSFVVTSSAENFSVSASKAELGVTGSLNFKFVGTYIGQSASRSNEAFGDFFDDYLRPEGTSGYNPYTISTYFTFTSGALPVKLVDFKAAKEGDDAGIYWTVADEANIDRYEVQRSDDGLSFLTIATVKAKNSPVSLSYNVKDESAHNGINYYRLVIFEGGRSITSKVVSLNLGRIKNSFVANYISGVLNITVSGISTGVYKLHILNNNGQLVQVESLRISTPNERKQVQLRQNLTKGIYRLTLQSVTAKYSASIFVQQ